MLILIESAYKILLILNTLIVFVLPIITVLAIILIVKSYRNAKTIKIITYKLQSEITNEKVAEYIEIVDKINIPNRLIYWNCLRAGYELINLEKEVNNDLKEKLKRVLLSKGVIV